MENNDFDHSGITEESPETLKEQSQQNDQDTSHTEFKNEDSNGPINQAGNHYGNNISNYFLDERKETERNGLPTRFFRSYVAEYRSKQLKEDISAIKKLVQKEAISIVHCVDQIILNHVADELATDFERKGFDIKEVFLEKYDRKSIFKLAEDLAEGAIKQEKELLLFIKDFGTYGETQQPPSIKDLNKIEINQASGLIGQLKELGCTIVYLTSSNTYTKKVFKLYKVDFLIPFLSHHDRIDSLEFIQNLQAEGRIPENELGLLNCLNWALRQDDFNHSLKEFEVNRSVFEDYISKGGIYPYVLFVGTFFRGLEFDEFQLFLFLLIEQNEKKKSAKKFMHKWNKSADTILENVGLNHTNETNLRLIDFINQGMDADSCKKILLQKKRIFLDNLANVIASPTFFFHKKFRTSTTQKTSLFLITLGQAYGRYYTDEIPDRFMERIREITIKRKKLQKLKEHTEEFHEQYNHDWNICNSIYYRMIRRFSDFLIEAESDTNAAEFVNALLDRAMKRLDKFEFIFDLFFELNYKSEKPVIKWYIKPLGSSREKERWQSFQGVCELLYHNSSNFFLWLSELEPHLPLDKALQDWTFSEKNLVMALFVNMSSQLPRSPEEHDTEQDYFTKGLEFIDSETARRRIQQLVKLLLLPNLEENFNELFPTKKEDTIISFDYILIAVFFIWHQHLLAQPKLGMDTCLIDAIRASLTSKVAQRKFNKALSKLKSTYNNGIIESKTSERRKRLTQTRNQLTHFKQLLA